MVLPAEPQTFASVTPHTPDNLGSCPATPHARIPAFGNPAIIYLHADLILSRGYCDNAQARVIDPPAPKPPHHFRQAKENNRRLGSGGEEGYHACFHCGRVPFPCTSLQSHTHLSLHPFDVEVRLRSLPQLRTFSEAVQAAIVLTSHQSAACCATYRPNQPSDLLRYNQSDTAGSRRNTFCCSKREGSYIQARQQDLSISAL